MPGQQFSNNASFYDRISHAYDSIADAGEHRAREKGESLLKAAPGEAVLEIGFGTGNALIDFAQQVGETGAIHGIDVSDGMLKVASQKIEKQGLSDRVTLKLGDARELPFDNDTFDAIFTSFTLELFPLENTPGVLAEAKRVLKANGRLGVVSMATVPDGESPSTLEKTYIWMHQHFPHIVDCQPIDVVGYVTSAGFAIEEKEELSIWTMPVRAIVARAAANA